MTALQSLEIRASEIRGRLSEIGGQDELSDETRSELEKLRREYSDNEAKQRALKIAGDAPATPIETRSGEGREFRSLVNGANAGEIFDAAINHNPITGATRELQQHYGLDGNSIPLALLVRSWPTDDELETRAVTAAPGQVGKNLSSIIPWVFPQSAAAFLGVDMPSVGVGENVYAVLTKELDVRTPAENADAAETTGTFSAAVLVPSRIQAAFSYSREDRARFAGMDGALRENLSMGLSDGLDDQVLTGTNGLFTGTNLANHAAAAATTYDNYIGHLAFGRVDGRYANTTGDLKVLMGASVYNDAGQTYRNTSVDRTALDRLMELVSGVRVSAHVPAPSNAHKQNAVVRRGNNRDMVAPVWEGITLIPGRNHPCQGGPDSHNGCHAARGQGVARRRLLQARDTDSVKAASNGRFNGMGRDARDSASRRGALHSGRVPLQFDCYHCGHRKRPQRTIFS